LKSIAAYSTNTGKDLIIYLRGKYCLQ